MLETYLRGTSAEHSVIVDALDSGLIPEMPCVPVTVHDVTIAGVRVQVKLGINNGTTLKADIRRPSAKGKRYTPDDIDAFAVVDPVSKRVAYLHVSEVTSPRRITLFLVRNHTRNGLRKDYRVQYFDDFTEIRRIVKPEECGAA